MRLTCSVGLLLFVLCVPVDLFGELKLIQRDLLCAVNVHLNS